MQALLKGLALTVAVVVALAGSASARAGVVVTTVGSVVTESAGVATARFKIQVANGDKADITNVRVVFGEIEIAIGDAPAETTVVSGAQKLLFDSETLVQSKNIPVAAKIKYFVDGVETVVDGILIFNRAE